MIPLSIYRRYLIGSTSQWCDARRIDQLAGEVRDLARHFAVANAGGFDAWLRQRTDAAHQAMMAQARLGGIDYAASAPQERKFRTGKGTLSIFNERTGRHDPFGTVSAYN